MSALFGKWINRKDNIQVSAAKEEIMPNAPYHMGIEKKFDIRDWNSFTPIQQDILTHSMLGSTSAYAKVWVFNLCVRKISQTAAMISNYSYLENVATGETVKGNKIFNILKNRCNPLNDGHDQIESLISYYIMNGNSYEMIIGTPAMPIEIWSLMAQNVTPIKGDRIKGEPIIKHYKDITDGNTIPYLPEIMIHTKTFNPESNIVGIPWLRAAASKIETLANAEEFNASVLENGVFPSINWHTDQDIPKEKLDEIKKQIDAQYAGPGNAGISMLTHSGFKAEKMAFSPEEMQLLNNERYIAAVIAILLGVPPELFGMLTEKRTYNNVREANADFINGTVLPTLEKVNRKRNHYFWPDGAFEIKINKNMIDAFKKDAADLNTSWWFTPDQKLEQQGHAPTGLPEMQERYIPAGFVNIKDLGEKEDKENL